MRPVCRDFAGFVAIHCRMAIRLSPFSVTGQRFAALPPLFGLAVSLFALVPGDAGATGPAGSTDRAILQPNGSYRLELTYLARNGCMVITGVRAGAVMQSGFARVTVTLKRRRGACTMALSPLPVTVTLPPHHPLRGALVTFALPSGKVVDERRITFAPQ